MEDPLQFVGARCFRYRILCSVLSQRPIVISRLRALPSSAIEMTDLTASDVGISSYEESFLQLIMKLSSGASLKVSDGGTRVYFRPGVLTGGKLTHDCGTVRGIGYFLEALLCLGPFCRKPVSGVLTGFTNSELDVSVDLFRTVVVPTVAQFGLDDGVTLRIKRRGAPPKGGGVVEFSCPVMTQVRPLIQEVSQARQVAASEKAAPYHEATVRRIRGIAYCSRMAASTCSRMIESARGVLNPFCADVFVYSDSCPSASDGGLSPGFSMCLVAETVGGALLGVEHTGQAGFSPDDVGRDCATLLLAEVAHGGLIDTNCQSMVLLWMCLSEHNVSKVCLGKLSQHSVHLLRHLKEFFAITFQIESLSLSEMERCVELSCVGRGVAHTARVVN